MRMTGQMRKRKRKRIKQGEFRYFGLRKLSRYNYMKLLFFLYIELSETIRVVPLRLQFLTSDLF